MCNDRDYQAHLERISDYLVVGEGVWWHRDLDTGDIIFHDGDDEPECRPEGPALKSFTETSLKSSYEELKKCWKECLEKNVTLPIKSVIEYDDNGDFLRRIDFQSM